MSNATQNSHNSGDSRRRRSRGGQNRRNNDNNSERRSNEGRQSGGGKREGATRNGGRQDKGKPQRRPMPAPVKLSWWQKLLKTIGLYKEPVRPPRPERRPDSVEQPAKTREPRRSQTRDARTENRNDSSEEKPARESQSRGNRRERGERDGGRRGGDPSSVENRRVYVGNLSYETTESDLEELFKGVGAVRRVEIVYNRNTHRSKGYGFVEMLDIDEAKRTVEVLHDQFFMGRQLTVSGAKSQEHETAEKEETAGESKAQALPVLAPLPPKEEVLDLVAEVKPEETLTETHAEIPTEEFHDIAEEAKTSEQEVTEKANA